MSNTPVCNEMYEAGLLNPAVADRIWHTYECNLKLAVTMFKSEELECCVNSLSARRLVVLNPASALSTAQTIWLLTQAQLDMGMVAQQNRKVDMQFIHKIELLRPCSEALKVCPNCCVHGQGNPAPCGRAPWRPFPLPQKKKGGKSRGAGKRSHATRMDASWSVTSQTTLLFVGAQATALFDFW